MSSNLRYARQVLLAEIGEAGQLRLERAAARVGGAGLRHEIAAAYALRAGIREVLPGEIPEALAPSFLQIPAARNVVMGSRAALSAMRAALGLLAPHETP